MSTDSAITAFAGASTEERDALRAQAFAMIERLRQVPEKLKSQADALIQTLASSQNPQDLRNIIGEADLTLQKAQEEEGKQLQQVLGGFAVTAVSAASLGTLVPTLIAALTPQQQQGQTPDLP
jgi:hypothetical protein